MVLEKLAVACFCDVASFTKTLYQRLIFTNSKTFSKIVSNLINLVPEISKSVIGIDQSYHVGISTSGSCKRVSVTSLPLVVQNTTKT